MARSTQFGPGAGKVGNSSSGERSPYAESVQSEIDTKPLVVEMKQCEQARYNNHAQKGEMQVAQSSES